MSTTEREVQEVVAAFHRAAIEGDAEGFWNSVMYDGNKRHVCGLSATYSLLRLLEGKRGTRLDYGYAADPAGGYVSYAGLVF